MAADNWTVSNVWRRDEKIEYRRSRKLNRLEINYPRTSVENDVELELGMKEVVERWELIK